MNKIAALEQSRRQMLIGALIGFGVWQGASVADQLLRGRAIPREASILLRAIALAAGGYWAVNLVRVLRWMQRVRADPDAATSLNDERVREARLRSFSFALFIVLAAQAIPLLAPVSAPVAAQLTILLGCTSAIGAFLLLDRA